MKVMVIVKATPSSEAGQIPSTELLTEMAHYNERLIQAGIMQTGDGLTPSSRGARVRFSGETRTVIDGPFAETKELIAGFWVWQVKSLAEAVEWVKQCPNPMPEESEIEIRPFYELDDFGDAAPPELREQEAAQRAVTLGLSKPSYQPMDAIVIAGLNRHYTMESRIGIPRQWEEFVPSAVTIPKPQGKDFFGVCWNTKPDCSFDYLTGIAVSSAAGLPMDMESITLAARRYAVFSHPGHVSTIPKTIETIWTKWVPEAGLRVAKQAPCFERYTPEFNPGAGLGGMEVWIPLE